MNLSLAWLVLIAMLTAGWGCAANHQQLRIKSARLSAVAPFSTVPSHTATVVIQPGAVRWLAPDGTVLNERVYNNPSSENAVPVGTVQSGVLFTGKHRGFSAPIVHAIEEVDPTSEYMLVATAADGTVTARFSYERLSLVRASDEGRFIATYGSPAPQGLPAGRLPAPPEGRYLIYDSSGVRQTEQGGPAGARYFQDMHDDGLVIDVSDTPGSMSRTVRLLRVNGIPIFEQPFEATRWDAVKAFFSAGGDFVIVQVTDTMSSPPGFSVMVWDRSGAERFRFTSTLSGEARSVGTHHLLLHEILGYTRHRFHLVELSASGSGRIVGGFDIEEAVQQFWGRVVPDENRLVFVVHYLDHRGHQQWRLQFRDPAGPRQRERRLDPPDPMLASAMLRSYGDGVHWIVANGSSVQLLVP